MVGPIGTLWARYKSLFVWWGITLLLIGAALVIQWREADLPTRYTAVARAEDCPLRVVVTYPIRLLLPVANTPEQTLLIQVTNAQNVEYTISLSKADWFVLYDRDGNTIPPYWEGMGDAVFMAVVKTHPDQTASAQNHQIKLSGKDNSFSCSVDLGEISVETANQTRWRLGIGIFARNIALPLGLLSAIAGWAVSYLGKEADKLEGAFREKIGKLATEFRSDPLYVVEQCLELKRIVSKRSLGRDAEKELSHVVHNLFDQDGIGRLLKQIGERASRQDNIALMSALSSVDSFYNKFASVLQPEGKVVTVFRALGQVYRYFSEQHNFASLSDLEQPTKTSTGKRELPPWALRVAEQLSWALGEPEWLRKWQTEKIIRKAENIVEQLLQIWDEQDVYSADFVVYWLNRLRDSPCIRDSVKKSIDQPKNRRRLKRYKQLDWLHEPSAAPYQWPELQTQDETYRYPKLSSWFEVQEVLRSNPFEKSNVLRVTARPEQWEKFISDKPFVFTSKSASDLVDAALLAQKDFQKPVSFGQKEAKPTFPIFFEIPATLECSHWLYALAHRAAEVWLEFLSYSPDAYLDMYPEERQALASWINWHCGSNDVAIERLRQRLFRVLGDLPAKREERTDDTRRAGQLLLDFLSEGKCAYTKENPPSCEQILHWLGIRPFGIDHTVVILVAPYTLPASLSQALGEATPVLLTHGIVLKQFRLEGDVSPEHAISIRWSKESLKVILAYCVKTSGGRERFADLFETVVSPK